LPATNIGEFGKLLEIGDSVRLLELLIRFGCLAYYDVQSLPWLVKGMPRRKSPALKSG